MLHTPLDPFWCFAAKYQTRKSIFWDYSLIGRRLNEKPPFTLIVPAAMLAAVEKFRKTYSILPYK